MTRFARAKGSKSSNEKKPEEATPWSEIKKSILSKKSNQPEKIVTPKEEVKTGIPKKPEWASLGDDFSNNISLIKQHLGKNNNNKKIKNCDNNAVDVKVKKKKDKLGKIDKMFKHSPVETKVGKKKKKLGLKDSPVEGSVKKNKRKLEKDENSVNEEPKTKKKYEMKKDLNMEVSEINESKIEKKNKKRKLIEVDSELTLQAKKKKLTENYRKENFERRNNFKEMKSFRKNNFKPVKDEKYFEKLRKKRRAEKALSRLKKVVCFHCRKNGHVLSECPNLVEKENTGTGICYKCGSTEHTAFECKVVKGTQYQFAECFICKEQGHIARQCPDNPRGLYPQGGACRECGDVTHLRKDCPKIQAQKAEEVVTVGLRNDRDLECLDEELTSREMQKSKIKVKKQTRVKF